MVSLGRIMKRFMAQVVIGVLAIIGLAGAGYGAAGDLNGHWAAPQIDAWITQGIIKGYPDGTIRPDAQVTRAEFMAMVNKAFDFSASSGVVFKDVSSGKWYATVVSSASAAGYIGGYPDGTMRPNAPISRFEAAVIIMKVRKLNQDATGNTYFSDARNFPSWAQGAVGASYRNGIMSGYPDGSFSGNKYISRAEAVIALTRGAKAPVVVEVPVKKIAPITPSPSIKSFSPAEGSTKVAVNSDIVITFTKIVRKSDNATLTNSNVDDLITLKSNSSKGTSVGFDATVTISNEKTVITVNPTSNLSYGKTYYISVDSLEDSDDQVLTGVRSASFTTVSDSAPRVESFSPASGASKVVINSKVVITFSKVVRRISGNATLDNTNVDTLVTLKKTNSSGANVPFDATVTTVGGKTVITVTPNVNLVNSQVYYAAVSNLEDTDDLVLTGTTYTTFTTTPSTDPVPIIESFSPGNGATDVALERNIDITFSETMRLINDSPLANNTVDGLITLRTQGSTGALVDFDATVTVTNGKTVITVNPVNNLLPNTRYYVAVLGVEDSANQAVAGNAVFTTAKVSADTLSNLTVSVGSAGNGGTIAVSPGFAGGTTSYTASVANGVGTVRVVAVAGSGNSALVKMGASVKSDGACDLNVGSNPITILVSKAGCNDLTYTLTVTREAAAVVTIPASPSFEVTSGSQIVTLRFSEDLADNLPEGTHLKSKVAIAFDGTNYSSLSEGDSVNISGRTLIVSLASPLSGTGNAVKIEAGTLKYGSGGVNVEIIVSGIAAP